ncbi:chemotaxis protein CheA [Rhodoferax sp. TBRC 17198]|uniref:chemotaxis protein CheA n=1 Tax=Rhodoferax potami TaxID=3068338 RepID=UPI0028BD1E07|nr:chemotaxis protein CheA [Rhodoferax sp. TBRC 17198]MDT7521174.1 chemotaxis protein CheA [Rhodoferax sp. TBRC 17198]
MNELLAQFLSEARDALEGIGGKLMELERAPDDEELMTQLFRVVHTLKGNSGLFDFPEMSRVLHAGEDLMDAVRHGEVRYSQTLADRLLDAMDFVGLLCDGIESDKPVSADMAAEAVRQAKALRALISPDAETSAPAVSEAGAVQSGSVAPAFPLAEQLARVPEAARMQAWAQARDGAPLLWVRYVPSEECFYQGDDPLHQANQTPGWLWTGMSARAAWPALAELDAYRCMLDFDVLVAADRGEVDAHYRYVQDQVHIVEVPALCLLIPQGDSNGGPVYEDFVEDALALIDHQDLTGFKRAVDTMIQLSSSSLWLSSALRWMQLLLTAAQPDTAALRRLVSAVNTFENPDWTEPAADPVAPAKPAALAQSPIHNNVHAMALKNVIDVQREVLALPDDAAWLPGRIKAAVASLSGCLKAFGRQGEVPALEALAATALATQTAAPLAAWLDQTFPEEAAVADVPAAPVAPVAVAPATVAPAMKVSAPVPAAPAPVVAAVAAPAMEPEPAEPELQEADVRVGRRPEEASPKSLKVDQVKIDRLMNLIGEMVVAKNAMPYLANRAETVFGVRELAREIKGQYATINRISEEMQDAIMQIRMMPVSFVFQRFPRLVRDISRRLGKQVNLELEGQETAADKNIIESLGDPLVHIVRNSLDHGFEMPEVRTAAGKPAAGTLRIAARQEADRVVIEITDDGKGIDAQAIKLKAYQKGLIDEATMDRISDQEAVNLVFIPGFSTSEVISDLSGRGVGMDVVRTAIEQVHGNIVLESTKGQGTRIRLSLPLSMAVTNVMTVESNQQMFGIPMDAVVETVRVPRASVRTIKQRKATLLRGRVVPLRDLNAVLGLAAPPVTNDSDEYAVLVVRVGDESLGLVVDDFHETADIILKPLSGVLSGLRAYSGSALMGDGSVLMVLNTKEML